MMTIEVTRMLEGVARPPSPPPPYLTPYQFVWLVGLVNWHGTRRSKRGVGAIAGGVPPSFFTT